MSEERNNNQEFEVLKEKSSEFVKAAGSLLGAAGKYAYKMGCDAKEKFEDPEFQASVKEKVNVFKEKAEELADKAIDAVKNASKE